MLDITLANNTEREARVRDTLLDLTERYHIPLFTTAIRVEQMARSHSHPVLTINTIHRDNPLGILETFVHEQFHWFIMGQPKKQKDECIAELGERYRSTGEDRGGPRSFYAHLIIIWNVHNWLKQNLSEAELALVASLEKTYPKTEALVREQSRELETILRRFKMVYEPSSLGRDATK